MQSTRYLNSSVWFLCIRSWQRRFGWYYLLFRIRTGVDNNFSQKYIKECFFLNFIRQKTEIGSSKNGSELTDFTFFHKIQTTGYFDNPRQQSPPLTLDLRTSTKSYKERVESHGQDLNILAIWHCCGFFVRKLRASAPLTMLMSDFQNIFVFTLLFGYTFHKFSAQVSYKGQW